MSVSTAKKERVEGEKVTTQKVTELAKVVLGHISTGFLISLGGLLASKAMGSRLIRGKETPNIFPIKKHTGTK